MPVFIINPSEFLFIISADRLMDFNKNDKLQPFQNQICIGFQAKYTGYRGLTSKVSGNFGLRFKFLDTVDMI